MLDTVLFDLDGTLLPMEDQEAFVKLYLKAIAMKFGPLGYDAEILCKAIWAGTEAMMKNDGSMTNEERFWTTFEMLAADIKVKKDTLDFDSFYRNEFSMTRQGTSTTPFAKQCIKLLKSKGYTLILATNPLFPKIATAQRISWAGLDIADFTEVTTYESYSFCKPSINYYNEILGKFGKKAENCLMVGNDTREDMVTSDMGMSTFLLTDCLINRDNKDIAKFNNGSFSDLYEYLKTLPAVV